MGAEQFGTNLRATATTTTPNFVRGSLSLLMPAFDALEKPLGTVRSGATLGVVTLVVALLALRAIDETHGKDLDFVEE